MEKTMKRITAILLALTLMISSLFCLSSCGEADDGAPDGMQLVYGGDTLGYYFYGPEEWVVANLGDIACTYASKIDTTSMTFVKSEMPAGTIEDYFAGEAEKFPFEITVVKNEVCNFGNGIANATKYVYTYTYKDISYTCMQIFVTNADEFYIFTFTANNAAYSDTQTYYDFYLEKATEAIEAFKFVEKTPGTETEPEYVRDADGYILVSDKDLAGFNFYVPDSYKVDYSSTLVSVSNSAGANINMSQATYTGVTNQDYWNARKDNINAFADKVLDAETGELVSSLKEIETAKQIKLEGTTWALVYEYTYRFEDVDYHVYQVLIVESSINGYVFTYIASEEHYSEYLEEAKTVLNKIEY